MVLIKLTDESNVLPPSAHHIVCDAQSSNVFLTELKAFYDSYLSGRDVALPPLAVQYADYAAWQRRSLAGENLARLRDYWRVRLAALPTVELRSDRPRSPVQSFRGAREAMRLVLRPWINSARSRKRSTRPCS